MTRDPTDPTSLTFLKLFTDDEGYSLVEPDEEGKVDAAVTQWVDSGGTRDTLLHLTMLCGDRMVVKASSVTSWIMSTPDGRARTDELESAWRASRPTWDEE